MIVYRLFRTHDGDRAHPYLGSVVISGTKFGVVYRQGEIATARPFLAKQGYHLTAFTSFQDAEEWGKDFLFAGRSELWSCKAYGEVRLPRMRPWGDVCNGIWPSTDIADHHYTWPSGTRMFKRIKPLVRLEPFYDKA